MRDWSTPPHDPLDLTSQWLAATMAIPPGEGQDFVVDRAGRVIGKVGLYPFPEVDFILHSDHRGRVAVAVAPSRYDDRAPSCM